MQVIFLHVAEGGTLIDLCREWSVHFSQVMRWIRADAARLKLYEESLSDRTEWVKERVLSELRSIGVVDISMIYDSEGAVLPVEHWPEACRRSIQAIEVEETFEYIDKVKIFTGYNKKVKFYDKIKAIDMVGKQAKLWSEVKDSSVEMKLEDLLALARVMPSLTVDPPKEESILTTATEVHPIE